ncbi:Two-component signal transduction system YycFG, regulatory protein YycI [Seinonella peptonophila]|uniref:Two-component signal transduction system YycFG, regulatory protein YycI n=1 Tax=Seinonella peptonophila TaxID=112248 RepID=A0A1M4WX65_9BACL|nr:two-component system regulatory protein YycI [Seinonella peptonophila]SHE85790.1 Two-component signal transduction system YycFG, regulatory protein YycI [Seinonella peptonophila]
MDWNRAKTIFIISFVVLDLFLGLQVSQIMEAKSRYLESNEITENQIRDLLEANHIRLSVPFPKEIRNIPVHQATITTLTGWERDEKWAYRKRWEKGIQFKDERSLQRFLKQQLPFFDQFQPEPKLFTADRKVYIQNHNGIPIFDGRVVCEFSKGKLVAIHVLHFQLKKETAVEFIPFNNALNNLITSGKLPRNSTITQIELGYRSPYYANPQEVILVPVWRFQANQKYYYTNATNATTGNLGENAESVQ